VKEDAVPGAAIAIQTFGDFLGFNPHTHILISDGCCPRLCLGIVMRLGLEERLRPEGSSPKSPLRPMFKKGDRV